MFPKSSVNLSAHFPDGSHDFKCEPDEYAKLVEAFKSAGIIGDNRKGLFNQKRTFTGNSFVNFLVTNHSTGRICYGLK